MLAKFVASGVSSKQLLLPFEKSGMQLLQCDGSIIEICNIVNQYWWKRVKINIIQRSSKNKLYKIQEIYNLGEKKNPS